MTTNKKIKGSFSQLESALSNYIQDVVTTAFSSAIGNLSQASNHSGTRSASLTNAPGSGRVAARRKRRYNKRSTL